ncbi:helix-turn-helix domain-containing protein [Paenibacillus sp. T2-29]
MYKVTLRAARINRGFTTRDVGAITGKSHATIEKYEKDSTNIPRDLSVVLLQLYKVPEEHIFFGKESVFIGFTEKRKKKKCVS